MTNESEIEQLVDEPTLLRERLLRFLDPVLVWQVMVVLSEVCNHCWNSELPCDCQEREGGKVQHLCHHIS